MTRGLQCSSATQPPPRSGCHRQAPLAQRQETALNRRGTTWGTFAAALHASPPFSGAASLRAAGTHPRLVLRPRPQNVDQIELGAA